MRERILGSAASAATVSSSIMPPTIRPAIRSANQCQLRVSDTTTISTDSPATADHSTAYSLRLTR